MEDEDKTKNLAEENCRLRDELSQCKVSLTLFVKQKNTTSCYNDDFGAFFFLSFTVSTCTVLVLAGRQGVCVDALERPPKTES